MPPLRLRLSLLAALLLGTLPLAAQAPVRPAGRPVVLGRDTILTLYARRYPNTLEKRALGVTAVLAQLAGRRDLPLDRIRIVSDSDGSVILLDTLPIVTALEDDATAAGVPRDTLAARWASSLKEVLGRRSHQYVTRSLATGVIVALLATLLFAVVVWLVLRLESRLERALQRWVEARLEGLRTSRTRLVPPAQVAAGVLGLMSVVRISSMLALGYLWLVTLFGAFEWTRPLASRILRLALEPIVGLVRGLVEYLPSLFFIGAVLLFLRLLVRGIHLFFRGVEQGVLSFRTFPAEWADPTYKIVRTLVIVFGFILVFPYLPGSGTDAFNAITLFAGALFSLGSTGAVSNIVSGSVLVYTRAFRVGDYVRIGETEGMVVERSLLVTRIRTATSVEVSIPSSTVLGSHVLNYSTMARQGGLVVQSRVTIGYDAPWRRVHELLLAAAARTEGVLASPEPFVVQEALNDYYPTYCLNAYTAGATAMEVFRLRSRLNEAIQDAFFEGGVEILSPAYTSIRDGNRTAMPPQFLPPDYRAPGWKVERNEGPA